ncbi:MAG: MT-A70 family methyltransferase, partial [Nitrososphaeraceae archaeon]
ALSGGNINNYGDRILQAWNFPKFVTKLYWDKGSIGMGANFRNQVEELWVAKRGNVKALHMTRQSTLVKHKRLPHSVKPDIFRVIVEDSTVRLFGKKRKMIELFKRRNPNLQKEFKKKWTYWGDQLH